ncbi:glycosyltransferase family 4 protein [Methylobacterium bullatum]|uniref:GDP-mannose-dependent alpha-(1-6)-phosphatidylinositol monomannoside mannosyltransferase n=1 Tax=Methylobacterium bullatum TaxID=570505 RepID=A0A679JW63_9HYPH|nr:GDP-mannose-dependent alpha-(1-6)-phosphatidylinositol monomannoside mannosyltransferase [Methylobacterium bullatum]
MLTKQKLRIAHLNPAYFSPNSYVGGGERYVDYIMQSLQSAGGFDQVLFSMGKDDQFFLRDGIPIRVLRNESSHPGMTNAFSGALWRELAGFDLVHIHQCLTLFGAYSTAIVRSLGIPTIGTDLGGGEDRQMLRGRCIELLDGVVSISQYAHNLLGSYFTGPHEILIGPVDTDRFQSGPAKTGRNTRNLICVSRILPHKGIDRVVAALPDALSLTIVGRAYHQPYYELLCKMAEGKNVRFILDADDDALLDLYDASGVFVQASTARDIYGNEIAKPELMGLTTLEAMSFGLPVLVSDAGSLPELVPDPRFGRVFANQEDLASILQAIAAGSWPGPNAGELARAHVLENHGFDTIGHRLAKFYKRIIAEKKN